MARTKQPLPRELPLHVRFLPAESTGSYVTRLAERNGLTAQQLLDWVGDGKSAVVPPHLTELYLNYAAAERLAALAGRPLPVLQYALASLGRQYFLPNGSGPAWQWPWAATDGHLVRACDLCAACRGALEAVYLMLPDPWHVCVRHRRWSDNARDPKRPWIDLTRWPQVIDAHYRLRRLNARMGPVGRVLFADALALLAAPRTRLHRLPPPWFAPVADRLGERRAGPLLAYATAVQIARILANAELRRLRGRLTWSDYEYWQEQAARRLGPDFTDGLGRWMQLHGLALETPREWSARSPHSDLVGPHTRIPPLASSAALSCLNGDVGAGAFDRPFL